MNQKKRLVMYFLLCSMLLLATPLVARGVSNGNVSGQVLDASTNNPIQGMYVVAKPVDENGYFDPTRSGTYKAYTASNGRYVISSLPPGHYKVIFNPSLAENSVAKEYIVQHYDGKATWDWASLVQVEGGSTVNSIDALLSRGGKVSGHVSGTPVATVFARPVTSAGAHDPNRYMRQASIDSSGNYTIIGLASGYYKLQAYQSGYADSFYNNKTSLATADLVFIGAPNHITGKNFTLVEGVSSGDVPMEEEIGDPGGGGSGDGGSGGGGASGGGSPGGGGAPGGEFPGTGIAAPTGLKASYANGKVTLSWNLVAAQGVAGYNAYRAEDTTTAGTLLNASMVTSGVCIDGTVEGLKTYYYYVTTVDESGIESAPSARVKVEINEALTPVTFSDVGRDHWAYQYISELASRKIIGGYADGTFRPNGTITRDGFAKMIVLASGWDLIVPSEPSFSDVPASYWAFPYIETAKARGVISGYPDGSFKPASSIKRAEIATMVVKSQGYAVDASGTGFPDVPQSHWAYDMVMTAKNKKIIGGYPGGLFKPQGLATRAESSKLIFSIIK